MTQEYVFFYKRWCMTMRHLTDTTCFIASRTILTDNYTRRLYIQHRCDQITSGKCSIGLSNNTCTCGTVISEHRLHSLKTLRMAHFHSDTTASYNLTLYVHQSDSKCALKMCIGAQINELE